MSACPAITRLTYGKRRQENSRRWSKRPAERISSSRLSVLSVFFGFCWTTLARSLSESTLHASVVHCTIIHRWIKMKRHVFLRTTMCRLLRIYHRPRLPPPKRAASDFSLVAVRGLAELGEILSEYSLLIRQPLHNINSPRSRHCQSRTQPCRRRPIPSTVRLVLLLAHNRQSQRLPIGNHPVKLLNQAFCRRAIRHLHFDRRSSISIIRAEPRREDVCRCERGLGLTTAGWS